MKKYNYDCDGLFTTTLFVGYGVEVRSLYGALSRHGGDFVPRFSDFPRFNPYRMYGLELCEDGHCFQVVGEHVIADAFYHGELTLVSDCGNCTPPAKVGRVTLDEEED